MFAEVSSFKHRGELAVVCIFAMPESYPPTLNAIERLSRRFGHVAVVCLGGPLEGTWDFPENCTLIRLRPPSKKHTPWRLLLSSRRLSGFTSQVVKLLKDGRPGLLLCYDDIAAYCGWKAKRKAGFQGAFWYHNHDAVRKSDVNRLTTIGVAIAHQESLFRELDLFSLPAIERSEFFPVDLLKRAPEWIPNYPERSFYSKVGSRHAGLDSDCVRMIFQGSLSRGHLFEELIDILDQTVDSLSLSMTLIGPIRPAYREQLFARARKSEVADRLHVLPPIPYSVLPFVTKGHAIGLAIHEPKGLIYSTGGTASNKIYEYAACGLPVLAFDSPHYRLHLERYEWVELVSKDPESLLSGIRNHVRGFPSRSESASQEIMTERSFAFRFDQAVQKLIDGR
ncbi:glycosyltransferase family protein [Rhodopirellula baltica]|uniref:Glycosyltransferase n=1 Tax=Rhodopirellula baltica SWK14 TaxID=993516 RepID=L7CMW6_RHOBT|nr:hypothetical protein [Rhodopirellula baltica]ELP34401.1 hypothetical protein RBSWK_01677 [Rhodopirellula baltica SWK14]